MNWLWWSKPTAVEFTCRDTIAYHVPTATSITEPVKTVLTLFKQQTVERMLNRVKREWELRSMSNVLRALRKILSKMSLNREI